MRTVLRGRILHCTDTPTENGEGVQYLEDGILMIEDGIILDLFSADEVGARGVALEQCLNQGSKLIVPGFIDTHIHAQQIDVIASYGEQLLQWLEQYTFPAEMRSGDEAVAGQVVEDFLDELLRNGTTTALVFSTSHEKATDLLFEAAARRNLCMITGKVLMDRNAPAELCDTAETGDAASRRLIERWHGHQRLAYAVTPRFAITSTPQQLQLAGRLLADYPGLYMQTHLSENKEEVATVKTLFPQCKTYLDAYDHYGLCTDRSVYAHCLHLEAAEIERLRQTGGIISFCPSSNLFLGSGLFPREQLERSGLIISLGTDVGGGTSFSMLKTLGDAYKVGQLQDSSFVPLKGFYAITLGNARALKLEHKVGNLAPGSDADFLVINPSAIPLVARRAAAARNIAEEWFAYMTLGDDRLIEQTWVAGCKLATAATAAPGHSAMEFA